MRPVGRPIRTPQTPVSLRYKSRGHARLLDVTHLLGSQTAVAAVSLLVKIDG